MIERTINHVISSSPSQVLPSLQSYLSPGATFSITRMSHLGERKDGERPPSDLSDNVTFQNASDEAAFLRQFAARIGVALRERQGDADHATSQLSIQECVHDLYQALVYDEPLLDHVPNLPVVASALARQLLDPKSHYAISNRLVNGIVYMCNKSSTAVKAEEDGKSPPTQFSPTASAMAKLAFACLVEVPLKCCTANGNLQDLQNFLGSYKGARIPLAATAVTKEKNDHDDDVKIQNLISSSRSQPPQQQSTLDKETSSCSDEANTATAQDQLYRLEDEVWAAESDPSDYDFTDGLGEQTDPDIHTRLFLQQHDPNFAQYPRPETDDEDWLDPEVLSKPDSQLSLVQARDSIQSLLQLASYTLLQPIFFRSESETTAITMTLTQLVLTLLQPNLDENDKMDLYSISDNAILAPLWIVRDAASYHVTNQKKNHDNMSKATSSRRHAKLASSYLQVLQTLLAVDQAHLQDLQRRSTRTKDTDLCVASVVGLSALSAWCTMMDDDLGNDILEMTIETLVDCMNDLAHVLERASDTDWYQERMSGSMVPFLEILSGIFHDHFDSRNSAIIGRSSSSVAQTLLHSGFLRQVLSQVHVCGENKTPPLQHPIYHALWGLCIAHSKIVGKYVFRHPRTTDLVRRFARTTMWSQNDGDNTGKSKCANDCVQCILWNAFGCTQCQDATGVLVLKSRGSSNPAPPLTQDECKEVCTKAWIQLCQLVEAVLQDSHINHKVSEGTVQEWNRLLTFARMPLLSTTVKGMLDSSLLDGIALALTNLPKESQVNTATDKSKAVDAAEDCKVHNDPNDTNKPSRQQQIISQTRKILKEYQLYFQGTVTIGSSKTD
jgi:hypothetical protein